jgi:hypothetical protein
MRSPADLVTLRLRLGGPAKSDESNFIGLAFDARVSVLGAVVGGAIAVSIVWIAMHNRQPRSPEAIETSSKPALAKVVQNS